MTDREVLDKIADIVLMQRSDTEKLFLVVGALMGAGVLKLKS